MRDLGRLLGFVRPYRGLAALSLLTLLLLVLLDLAIPRLVQRIVDQGILPGDSRVVATTALGMLGLSVLSAVIAIANNYFSVRVGEGVARDLREALFLRIQTWSFGNLDRQNTGNLMTRLTSDVAAIKMVVQMSLRIGTRAPLMLVGSLALMFLTSQRLALALVPLLLVTAALVVFFVVRMEPRFLAMQEALDGLNRVLQENIAGVRVVKSLGRGGHEAGRFRASNEEMTRRSVEAMRYLGAMSPSLTLCINLGVVLVVGFAGFETTRAELSLGQVVAFSNYLLATMTPLVMMTMLSNTLAAGMASAGRLVEVLDAEPEVRDGPGATDLPPGTPARVELSGVSFAYRGEGNAPALHDLDLVAVPGETVAILGATGAGKTSLVNLVPRFYDATAGRVELGGRDVRQSTQDSLLALLAVVPQETVLFSGTIRDNIRYGRPDASDAEVEEAARVAEAHGFVSALEQGYGSRVEARGANLSGGQRQRLAIARALLMRPALLVLDDATSAVDVETEARIHEALARDRAGRTTLVVAQRVSTVLRADRIVVLDKGRIVAQGTHRELLASSPIYQEIYESQLGRPPDPGGPEGARP